MTLDDWRLDQGLTFKRLAELLSTENQTVDTETVRRWCMPESATLARMPDRIWLRKIYEVSGGLVAPNDFVLPPEE
jgi:hypothetical protein